VTLHAEVPPASGDTAKPQGRLRSADATKARLLAAAEIEFAAKGFDGARLGNIARVAGVQQALIHHYFADKDGLYEEVLARGLAAVTREGWDILDRFAPGQLGERKAGNEHPLSRRASARASGRAAVRELTEAFVDVLVRFYATHSALLAIIRHDLEEPVHMARSHVRPSRRPLPGGGRAGTTVVDELVRKTARPVFEAVVGQIEELKALGVVRQDVDARHLCVSVMAMACFPLQEARLLSAFWSIDWRDPGVLETRKGEIVQMVLARALP
jgi:TetR/AcrR family transcriptional regulator